MAIDPLIVEFEVRVPPAQAFASWTDRCSVWWPRSHTVTGDPAAITFEPWVGGRIVERGRDGREHEWGAILDWEAPVRLRFSWHLFFPPREATEVEVTFRSTDTGTAIRLEQRGWERLGTSAAPRRERTQRAWAAITNRYADAL